MLKILKRYKIKKLLRRLVQTTVVSSVFPALEVDRRLLPLLSEKVWNGLTAKHLTGLASDKEATGALFSVLDKRSKALVEDLADLLEDSIEYGDVQCPVCHHPAYGWTVDGTATGICLKCAIKEENEDEGDNLSRGARNETAADNKDNQ